MLNNSAWYAKAGENSDAVVSTRIRLARNLRDFPFSQRLDPEDKKRICEVIRNAVMSNSEYSSYQYIDMESLSDIEAVSLVERHLISPDFAGDRSGRGLILNKDETVSIMICEEDHIRLQVISAGLDFDKAYAMADNIDTFLDEKLNYAFDEKLGYLTACPTNLGTGMRASVMLHFPALQESGSMQRIAASLSKIGLTLRGSYGEDSNPYGALYQLSNQVTLGLSEKSAIENLRSISAQIIEQERDARKNFLKNELIIDRLWRSYSILKYARLLSNDEFMKYLSNVRLAVSEGIIEGLNTEKINELMVTTQPAMLLCEKGENLSQRECDAFRAQKIRHELERTGSKIV